ncbi:MAG: EpsI family protein [Candidatus Zixiibacteriota bacterium]|nr:MAG: EpsI family protein [candidate division Zixibacteria bacterium]
MNRPVLIVSLIILIGGMVGNSLRFIKPEPNRGPSFSEIPFSSVGYVGQERRFSEASYDVLKADTTTLRQYVDEDGSSVSLFVGYFASQKFGSQIHSPKHCLPGSGWKIIHSAPYHLELPGGISKKVNRFVITEHNHRELMLYWFETRGGTICDEFGLKWDLMKNSLLLRPTDAAFIRLNLPIADGDDVESATRKATAFFTLFYPSISQALPFDN